MHRSIHGVLLSTFLAVVTVAATSLSAADSHRRTQSSARVITSPRLDPDAEQLALFDGIEDGSFETRVIAMGPSHGNLLISNKTPRPLTVVMPKSFVAVHVLKQFGPSPAGPGGNSNQNGPQGNQPGGQQAVGGGAQQNNQTNQNPFANSGNGSGPAGNGDGFFSIPPERTVRIPYVSACLEHGKADPTPRANYKLVRTEDYTQDRVLQVVIAMVASGRLDSKSAQAAIWNRSDRMTWEQLATKYVHSVTGRRPYFKPRELTVARKIVDAATRKVSDRIDNSSTDATVAVIRSR